jgi:hypothetical protein
MLIPNNLISPDYHLELFDLTADGGHLEFHLEFTLACKVDKCTFYIFGIVVGILVHVFKHLDI